MSSVRRFTERDIPEVAELHRRVFRPAAAIPDSWLERVPGVFLRGLPERGARH